MKPADMPGIGRLFAVACLLEGLTWAGLLIGLLLKYATSTTELGVWLFGRLHGVAFLFYVVVSIIAARRLQWPWWVTSIALLAAIPPLVTIPMEIWFKHCGFLIGADDRKLHMQSTKR